MKTYEALFIFTEQNMTDEALEGMAHRIRGEVEKAGGKLLESVPMGRRGFARPLQKKDAGYYIQMVFELPPENVAAFRGRIRLITEIFRSQVTAMDSKQYALWKARMVNRAPEKSEEI